MKQRLIVDFLMTVLLITLMAYQVTGERIHSRIGVVLIPLFLLHNLWNIRWYKSLLKGKYTVLRAIKTLVNLGFLAAVLCACGSGIFLAVQGGRGISLERFPTAEAAHLIASHLIVIFMLAHLILHAGMLRSMIHRSRWKDVKKI